MISVKKLVNVLNVDPKSTVETVCLLGNKKRKPDDVLKVTVDVDRMHEILEKEKAEKEIKEAKKSE